jgi:hypothetical protein
MSDADIHHPDHLKHKVLRGLSIAVAVFAVALSILNIYLQQYLWR